MPRVLTALLLALPLLTACPGPAETASSAQPAAIAAEEDPKGVPLVTLPTPAATPAVEDAPERTIEIPTAAPDCSAGLPGLPRCPENSSASCRKAWEGARRLQVAWRATCENTDSQ